VDVLDLDDVSFRAFVIDMLRRAEIVTSLKAVYGEHVPG